MQPGNRAREVPRDSGDTGALNPGTHPIHRSAWNINSANFAFTFSEVGKLRRGGTLIVWQGFRISAISPLPAHQVSQKPESRVVLKTIALCSEQTIATQRTQQDTFAAREQERCDLRRGMCNRRVDGEALVSIDAG
jgi:hypothetical protein